MCGIVGYIGREEAAPILLDGLKRLEYRGYDSAGMAVYDPEEGLTVAKAKGRLSVLSELTEGIHLHTLSCPDEAAYARIQTALRHLGVLVEN